MLPSLVIVFIKENLQILMINLIRGHLNIEESSHTGVKSGKRVLEVSFCDKLAVVLNSNNSFQSIDKIVCGKFK